MTNNPVAPVAPIPLPYDSRWQKVSTLRKAFSGDSLKAMTMRGSAWTIVAYGVNQVLRLAGNLVLTRLLFPEAFGLMNLVVILLMGLQMFTDIAVGPAILRAKDDELDATLRTGWTIQILRGLVLAVIGSNLAWVMANAYGEPVLKLMVPVVMLGMAINSFRSVNYFAFSRAMKVVTIVKFDLAIVIITQIVTLLLAWQTRSAWALPLGMVAGNIISTAASFPVFGTKNNRLMIEKGTLKAMTSVASWTVLSTAFLFFIQTFDAAFLGKKLGMELLGIYGSVQNIARTPELAITAVFSAALMPALARLHQRQDDDGFYAKASKLRTVMAGSAIGVGLLSVGAVPLIKLLYDDRYLAGGRMLAVMGAAAYLTMLCNSALPMLMAAGKFRLMFMLNLVFCLATCGGAAAGYYMFGAKGLLGGLVVGRTVAALTFWAASSWYRLWSSKAELVSLILLAGWALYSVKYLP